MFIFFFKQKTAYEMRISDWSSDVCSSDLRDRDADLLASPRMKMALERVMQGTHVERLRQVLRDPASPRLLHRALRSVGGHHEQIGRASCRERVCQYV